jgi:isopentenyldiphosphate isomerase
MAHDMEWVDIVDEQDRVVGRATRAEMRAGNLLHRCVAIFCFDADRRRVYVHRRTAHKDVFPNLYDMSVGGVVRAGEDYASAARREIDEELAIAGPVPELLFRHRYEGSLSRSHTAVYQVSWSGPIRHQASEVAWGAFLTIEEVAQNTPGFAFVPDGWEIFQRFLALKRPVVSNV